MNRFSSYIVFIFMFFALSAEELDVTIIKAWRHGATDANKNNLLCGGGSDDSEGVTALNEEGKKQAYELGQRVVESGDLDVIYSSDLSRALDTAEAVLGAYECKGKKPELRISKQLREILHGKLELTDGKERRIAATARIQEMLAFDELQLTPDEELRDPFRFWKIHPQVTNAEVVPEEIVDVEDYINRGETRPETPYQLYQRINQEFIRIAKENPGKTIGVSMHGAGLSTLLEAMNKNPKGIYLPPHYNNMEIKIGDQVILPSSSSVANCALLYFKYDFRTDQLESILPR